MFILYVPFLIKIMVSIAEGIPLLGLQPELALAALLVSDENTRLPCALISTSVHKTIIHVLKYV